ncbi:MAG: rRNA maturation RNase YbeY [Alphaproteobacteria bacterium]|nr:rRNA maturation RNase YbeY [Alphaproteobacteria bacterium]
MSASEAGVEAIVEAAGWARALPEAETLARRVFDAARAREPRLAGEAAILFTDDATVRDLNRRFRGKDAPTNVLSFPSGAAGLLGDVALAYETCAREAREKGVALADHAAHLIAHGLLHLVGYDHMDDREALLMERLETAILGAVGVADPYEEAELES